MATYTMEDAASRLPEFLAKAAAGEKVSIAQHDGDRVRLVREEPMGEAERAAIRKTQVEWLRAPRVTLSEPVDFTVIVRQMRDEDP